MAQDTPYLHHIANMPLNPVFILGPARSGTTILYQVLAASGRFNVVTLYHVLRHDQLLFNHFHGREDEAKAALLSQFDPLGSLHREIDTITVHPDLEEEYGHVLGDRLRQKRLRPNNLDAFRTFARKVQFISGTDRPLLLKNPWDFANFTFLSEHFPEARFIFIHRHPTHVLSSTLRAVRLGFRRQLPYLSLIGTWYRRLFRNNRSPVLLREMFRSDLSPGTFLIDIHLARQFRGYADNIHHLDPGCYRELKYEDLCLEPRRVLEKLARFLGPEDLERALVRRTAAIRPRRLTLSQGMHLHSKLIHRLSKPYWARFGYRP